MAVGTDTATGAGGARSNALDGGTTGTRLTTSGKEPLLVALAFDGQWLSSVSGAGVGAANVGATASTTAAIGALIGSGGEVDGVSAVAQLRKSEEFGIAAAALSSVASTTPLGAGAALAAASIATVEGSDCLAGWALRSASSLGRGGAATGAVVAAFAAEPLATLVRRMGTCTAGTEDGRLSFSVPICRYDIALSRSRAAALARAASACTAAAAAAAASRARSASRAAASASASACASAARCRSSFGVKSTGMTPSQQTQSRQPQVSHCTATPPIKTKTTVSFNCTGSTAQLSHAPPTLATAMPRHAMSRLHYSSVRGNTVSWRTFDSSGGPWRRTRAST